MSRFSFPSSQSFSEPAKGIIDQPITPNHAGRVKYRGTYWIAKLYQPEREMTIPTGEPVTIMGIQGITLLVAPTASF
jgi:membrane protein implicated in regulation of membrane protease activity